MNVTFCGHSKINQTDGFSNWLDMILPSLIEGGASTFYLGGYGAFDGLAAAAVRRQKETYPHIEMVLVLAYLNRDVDASRYDSTTYPPLEKVPPRYAIVKRNEWMVCKSDVVISGVTLYRATGASSACARFNSARTLDVSVAESQLGRRGQDPGICHTKEKGDFSISRPDGERIAITFERRRILAKNLVRRYADTRKIRE